MPRVLVALLSAVGLAGCDQITGVSRDATVAAMPTRGQVLAAARGTPGVDSAYVPFNFAAEPPDSAVTVVYAGGTDVRGLVTFVREPGGVRYAQSIGAMGPPRPQREFDASYPVMLAVEARLEGVPGLAGLRRAVMQTCTGPLKCDGPSGRPVLDGG